MKKVKKANLRQLLGELEMAYQDRKYHWEYGYYSAQEKKDAEKTLGSADITRKERKSAQATVTANEHQIDHHNSGAIEAQNEISKLEAHVNRLRKLKGDNPRPEWHDDTNYLSYTN